jgi:undecaprenyl-phosphate galactose phosphotransferase/putative colanic acid biosynthesis UDP-glucose lipid carrier transferase
MLGFVKVLLFFADLICLNLCVYLSFALTGQTFSIQEANGIYLVVFSNITWLYLVLVSPPYNVTKSWSVSKIIKSQVSFLFIHLLVVIALVIFFKRNYPPVQIALIYIIFLPIYFIVRIVAFYLRRIFSKEIEYKNFILVGRNSLSDEIRKYYLMNPSEGRRFVGYVDIDLKQNLVDSIQAVTENQEVHEIYVCVADINKMEVQNLVNFGLDSLIKVRMVISGSTPDNQLIQLARFENLPGRDVATIALDEARFQIIKRIFDLLFVSVIGVFILSWLVPLVGIIIKLDSPGPVFFVQLRSGEGNRPFNCFKFRTMKVNAQADTHQASKNDPRITKIGHFLRKTSIDELPQFINVLIGTMSVVGPRPHMLKHTEEYAGLIDKFMGRHYVKPGITGLAQCLGYRGETKDLADMENRVRMDRYYIENWTFWLDIKIIFLTVVSLIRGSDKAF